MTRTIKIIIITLTSMTLLFALLYFGLHGFVYSIYSQRTCEWANIDNIELHAHVDIPRITNCDCKYEKEQNTKLAHFSIDKNNFDMTRYIQRNSLKKVSSSTEIPVNEFLNLESNIDELVSTASLYYKEGSHEGENYNVLLDNRTGGLWVTIKYKD